MAKLFFNQKLFHFFCQNVPSSIMVYCIPYMEVNVDFLPYMEVNVGKKKKGKTWRNEVDNKTVKIGTSEIHIQARRKGFCFGGAGNSRRRRDVYSWGFGGRWKPPNGSRAEPWWGSGGEPPEALQFHSFKGHRLA